MRKLFFSIAFMLVVGLLVHSCWSLITERVPAANLLSLKHARLYMSEPDQKLIMPLRSVRVRHVKDS